MQIIWYLYNVHLDVSHGYLAVIGILCYAP